MADREDKDMNITPELIEKITKEVISQLKTNVNEKFVKKTDPSGVICVKTETVACEPFDPGTPANVKLKDIVTLEESPRMGCGILELEKCTYPWQLTYDEFYYVVDGVLDIIVEGRHNQGTKGDIIHIPKGTSIYFSTPSSCRAVYFTYPADWENAE